MFTELSSTSAAGALFGAALAASGVYLPSVITSQMELSNFHMLKVFLTASTSSSIALLSLNKFGFSETKPRPSSTLGLFGRFDGNVLGGCMIGLGMTLTGSCSGTVLVQLSTGVRSGWFVFAGGVLGGIVYAGLSDRLRQDKSGHLPDTDLTVHEKFGMKSHHAILMYELFCVALLGFVTVMGPKGTYGVLSPLSGGALIGAAQAASLLLTGSPVGVSTGYEVLGSYFWRVLKSSSGSKSKKPLPAVKSVYFALGIVIGGWIFTKLVPLTTSEFEISISPRQGIIGGFIMVMGARIAGGCTSGHGISGMSMLSVSSFVTVAFMFIGGIGSALLV